MWMDCVGGSERNASKKDNYGPFLNSSIGSTIKCIPSIQDITCAAKKPTSSISLLYIQEI